MERWFFGLRDKVSDIVFLSGAGLQNKIPRILREFFRCTFLPHEKKEKISP
jgi:hypothetical protein